MSEHPYLQGDRVYHAGQGWHRPHMGGTATVVAWEGPMNDGSYEYEVIAGAEFSRRTGPENPEVRPVRWSSLVTRKVEP